MINNQICDICRDWFGGGDCEKCRREDEMKKNEGKPLATEVIHILKTLLILVLILWAVTLTGTTGGFLWHLNTPSEESVTTTIDQSADNTSTNQVIGGNIYGSKTDDNGH